MSLGLYPLRDGVVGRERKLTGLETSPTDSFVNDGGRTPSKWGLLNRITP